MEGNFVNFEDKESFVQQVFTKVAKNYDLFNTLISLNQDHYWRRRAVNEMNIKAGSKCLDVACGTCMVTAEIFRQNSTVQVDCLDFNSHMLEIGKKRIKRLGKLDQTNFLEGNAMKLPYEDDAFDCAVSAFALRNVPDIPTVIGEMKRVVKPGGMVVTLELAKPRAIGFKQAYSFYFNRIMPTLVKLGRGDSIYQWLPESWRMFPSQESLAQIFRDVGLEDVSFVELTGGVVAVHKGRA